MAVAKTKVRKKRWFKVLATELFGSGIIGETPAYEPEEVMGRTAAVSMMVLTGEMKKQNMIVTFVVNEVKDDKAMTYIKKFELSNSFTRRAMRKDRVKLDFALNYKNKDNKDVIIKPFILVRKAIGGTQLAILRRKIEEFLKAQVNNSTYDSLMKDVLSYKLQRDMKGALNKVYPLKTCEIRVLDMAKEKMQKAEPVQAVEQPKAEVSE